MRRLMLLLALALVPSLAHAQLYEYAAKYTCGKANGSPDNFAPGIYYTSVNVHATKDTDIRKRFTVSLIDERWGGSTGWIGTGLPGGQSLQIECRNILAHLSSFGVPIPPGQVVEGFVIIDSPVLLDVFGVYTAAGPDWVSTLHMEHIIPREVP